MNGAIWCLHGAVGMAEDWRGFSVPGWAVKRIDLWRFLDCCPMGLGEFARALNEEAAATGGRKVLLGYSMGGRLALHALMEARGGSPRARPAPGRGGHLWEAAVMVSAHPGLEDEAERASRREMDAEWAARALAGEWREFLESWNSQPVLAGAGAGLADRMRLELRRRAVARSFIDWSLGAQEPLWTRLGETGCPVLWVAGERDRKFRELAERAADGSVRPSSRWIAPGVGHRVPWESAEFSGRVGEFLERNVS